MMQLTVFLVVGMATLASPTTTKPPDLPGPLTDIFKTQFLTKICSEKPSPSACVTEAEECFQLLQIDLGLGLTDMDTISNSNVSYKGYIEKANTCIGLLLGITEDMPSGPVATESSSIIDETGDPFGSSTSNDSVPARENLEVMCQFVEIPSCLEQVDKCFGILGPGATPSYRIKDLLECALFFEAFAKATGNLTDTTGITGRPGDSGLGVNGSSSTPSPAEEFVFSGASMEQMCQFVDIPNCLQRVEECSLIMGPDVPVSAIPTKEMLDCSTFFVSLAEAAGNITASIGITGGSEGSGLEVFGSSSTSSPLEGPFPSKASMLIMCQFVEILNCSEQVDRCFGIVGPGAPPPSFPNKELLECSAFFESLADGAANFTDKIGVTDGTGGSGLGVNGSSSTPSRPGESFASKETMKFLCVLADIPNCPEQVERCFGIVGPGAPPPSFPNKEVLECSAFFASLAEGLGNSTDTTEVTGGTDGSTPSLLERTFPSKASILVMCQFVDIPNCSEDVDRCFGIVGPGASPPSFPNKELLECSTFFESLADAASNFTDTLEITYGLGGSGLGVFESSSTPSPSEESFPSKASMEVLCQFVEIPTCLERVDKCFGIVGPGTLELSFPTPEVLECLAFFSSLEGTTKNLTDTVVTGGPGGQGPDNFGSSSTPSPSEESVPSRESVEFMCQSISIPNCVERVEKCFRIQGSGMPDPSIPIKELLECSKILKPFVTKIENFTGTGNLTVSGNLTDILPCGDEKCKTCEKLLEPTPDFLKDGQKCLFKVAGNPKTLSLKECMKPAMEKLLNSTGTSEIRPKLQGFFESCFPLYDFEGIRLCIIAECSKIV